MTPLRPSRPRTGRAAVGAIVLAVALAAVPPVAPPSPVFAWEHACALEAEFVNHRTRVLPPPAPPGLRGDAPLRPPATFQIEYVDMPPAAQQAFEAAAAIWARHVASPVPIRIRATWAPLAEETVLANAAPRLVANFATALRRDTFYPVALANALEGRDLDPGNPHMEITANAAFPRWYFGLDGNPPENRFDFVTVILHEIGHGLGVFGSMTVVGVNGRWGLGANNFPTAYDRAAEADVPDGTFALTDERRFPNPSVALADALRSDRVYFSGPAAVRAQASSQAAQSLPVGPGARPVLHAPPTWRAGSSFNHLTETTDAQGREIFYPPGSLNSLMTPRLGAMEVIHTPGPVVCGMLRDLGWPLGADCFALLGEEPLEIADAFMVVGPCPNPAGPGGTRIGVFVPEPSRVRVDLFDLAGRRVRRIYDGPVPASQPTLVGGEPACPAGVGGIAIPTDGLPGGVYLVRIQARGAVEGVRLTVVR